MARQRASQARDLVPNSLPDEHYEVDADTPSRFAQICAFFLFTHTRTNTDTSELSEIALSSSSSSHSVGVVLDDSRVGARARDPSSLKTAAPATTSHWNVYIFSWYHAKANGKHSFLAYTHDAAHVHATRTHTLGHMRMRMMIEVTLFVLDPRGGYIHIWSTCLESVYEMLSARRRRRQPYATGGLLLLLPPSSAFFIL